MIQKMIQKKIKDDPKDDPNSQQFGENHAYIAVIGQVEMNTRVHTKTCNPTQNNHWICNTTHQRTVHTYMDL